MSKNFTIFRFLNIDFRLNLSFIIFYFSFYGVSLFYNSFYNFNQFLITIFFIILHELGHATQAIYLGYKCDSITLYPFGGAAVLNINNFNKSFDSILITLAGPIVNLIFCLLFSAKTIFLGYDEFTDYLFKINLILFLFNLVPIGFLDGGRILSYFLCQNMRLIMANNIKYILEDLL